MADRARQVISHLVPLSISHGPDNPPLKEITLGDHIRYCARARPNQTAITSVWQERSFTYSQLDEESNAMARSLVQAGVAHGDRVAIFSGNSIEYLVLLYAVAKIGAIFVVLNPSYTPTELTTAVLAAGASTLFIALDLGGRSLEQHIENVTTSKTSRIILLPKTGQRCPAGSLTYQEFLARTKDSRAIINSRCSPFDIVNMQFTSGTTGAPKAACLTHHNLINNALFVGRQMNLSSDDILCVPVPLFHCFGLVLGSLAAFTHECGIVFPSEVFNARAVLEAVQSQRCTALHGVPTMFIAILELLEKTRYDTKSLRTGICAGTVVNAGIMSRIQGRLGLMELCITYGQTETSPASTMTSVTDPMVKRTSTVGRVLPHTICKIVDEEGKIVPRNTPGEVYTAGYLLQKGYWNNEKASADALATDENGTVFLKTGDVGIMDNEGYLRIPGRLKDLIIRGGENINPSEVEDHMAAHESISDVSVVAITDERYGEVVGAFVILHKDKKRPEPQEFVAFCTSRGMARYKHPVHIFYMGEEELAVDFPKTMSGKIQKYILRNWGNELVKKRGLK